MDVSRSTALILVGIALFVTTATVGAITAPDQTIERTGGQPSAPGDSTVSGPSDPTDGTATAAEPTGAPGAGTEPRTIVGMQGTWERHGSVFALDEQDEVWRHDGVNGYFEVSRLDNGSIVAAFSNKGAEDCGEYDAPCSRTGFHVLDPTVDGGPEVVAEYSFPVRRQLNREVHAVDATENGFVFTDMDRERIAVVEDGTVVWEWNASSLYDAPPDPTKRDWLHINDVDVIGDGRFLVSVRNANQIVVVERGEGVVEVINEDDDDDDSSCTKDGQLADFDEDGEVQCGDPDVINHQHNPQWLGDGAVLVADSENDRVVELHRNGTTGTWKPVWVVRKTNGLDLNWPRDADRLPNGNTLITDSLGKRIVEVTPDGTAVWSAPTDRIPYEADRLPYGEVVGGAGQRTSDGPSPTQSSSGGTTETAPGNTVTTPPSTAPETTNLPQLTASDPRDVNETGSDVPGLSQAVAGLQGLSPMVPFWFREPHLAVTILSVVLVVSGGADLLRTRYRK